MKKVLIISVALIICTYIFFGCSDIKKEKETVPVSAIEELEEQETQEQQFVGEDIKAGIDAAEKTVAQLKEKNGSEKGIICILQGQPEDTKSQDYQNGIYTVLDNYEDIIVAAEQFCENDPDKAFDMICDYVQKYFDTDAIIVHDSSVRSGVQKALTENGLEDLTVIYVK